MAEVRQDELDNALRYESHILSIRIDAYMKWMKDVIRAKNWKIHGEGLKIARYPDGTIGQFFQGETQNTYIDEMLVRTSPRAVTVRRRRFTFEPNSDVILSVEVIIE